MSTDISMANPEIERFAQVVRDDAAAFDQFRKLDSFAHVTAFAQTKGFTFTEEDLQYFLTERRASLPGWIKHFVPHGKQLDFSEESIVRFSALRLQIDADY
jgi:hypothetical protein